MRRLADGIPLFAFSLRDLEELDGSREAFERLREAGLDGIAEVPVDLLSSAAPVRSARAAGLAVLRLTVDHRAGQPPGPADRGADVQPRSRGLSGVRPAAATPLGDRTDDRV